MPGWLRRLGGHSTLVAAIAGAVTATPAMAADTIWEQADHQAPSATTSTNFEPALDDRDSSVADDFRVGPGRGWRLGDLVVDGMYSGSGPATSVNVVLYRDAGGLPDATVASYFGIDYADFGNTGDFQLLLTPPVDLGSGHYWVAVQANMDSHAHGSWRWTNRTAQKVNGAVFENPGDGSNTGCTTWTLKPDCFSTTYPDQAFQIHGESSATSLSLAGTAARIKASGFVSPPAPGVRMKVRLFHDTGSGIVLLDQKRPTLDSHSNYATNFPRPGGGGTCTVKAAFPGTASSPPSAATESIGC